MLKQSAFQWWALLAGTMEAGSGRVFHHRGWPPPFLPVPARRLAYSAAAVYICAGAAARGGTQGRGNAEETGRGSQRTGQTLPGGREISEQPGTPGTLRVHKEFSAHRALQRLFAACAKARLRLCGIGGGMAD